MGIKGIWSWYIVRVLNFKQHVITGNEKINILVWSHILGKSYFFVSKVIKCELKYNLGSFTWIQYMLHPSGAGIGASHGWYCKEWWVCLLLTATGRFVISLFSFSEEDEYDTHLPSNLIKFLYFYYFWGVTSFTIIYLSFIMYFIKFLVSNSLFGHFSLILKENR